MNGQCKYLMNKTSIITSNWQVYREITKFYMFMPYKINAEIVNDMENIYKTLIKIREVMNNNERKTIRVIVMKGIN